MTRKSRITDSLSNSFPEWTRIRTDDQSVGKLFLNASALQIEDFIYEVEKGFANSAIQTFNLDEIDITHKIELPNYFKFDKTDGENINSQFITPTVSGLLNSWQTVTSIESGSLKEFWYQAVPTRFTSIHTYSGITTLVASGNSTNYNLSIINSGLFLDNKLTAIVNGQQLIGLDSDKEIQRSKLRFSGDSQFRDSDTEDLVFLFSDIKQTYRSWELVNTIEAVDFYSESDIYIYSHAFNLDRYLELPNLISQDANSRENIPYFWSLGLTTSGTSIMQAEKYTAPKALDLLTSPPQFEIFRSWELLDLNQQPIEAVDISLISWQQRLLALSESKLYLYDTYQELPDVSLMFKKTTVSNMRIETDNDYYIRDQEAEINILFARPVKTIIRHRVRIQYPDGQEYGILEDGSLVSTSTDYYSYRETSDRNIRPAIFLQLEDFGTHIITVEAVYLDQTQDITQRAILVNNKIPLAEFDLSALSTQFSGIDIDHKNRILLKTIDNNVHHIELNYDYYLLDFENKEIIFREKYNKIKVIK